MTVTCTQTTKTYALGIKNVYAMWCVKVGTWHRLTEEVQESLWYNEEYEWLLADTSDLITNMLQYFPGVKETCDYGDFHVTFDMDEVAEAGWSEAKLVQALKRLAKRFNTHQVALALDAPYRYETTDTYGSKIYRTNYPALIPMKGLIEVDYPQHITP